jgi:PIN domain nuclease of toxin-antitoxin system
MILWSICNNEFAFGYTYTYIHRDPFDRLLIATAISEKMCLVTADENIQNILLIIY